MQLDIILTKSISRFARNTVDLLETVRHLKELGVEVRFEEQSISTFSNDGELMLTILASFAQEESRSISENVTWGHRKRFADGKAMGAVLGAVSPAVVVPRMVQLMEEKYGTDKQIPQLILAGASLDDVFVIVLFSTFISIAQGGSAKVMDFVNIPVSILLGILIGALFGFVLSCFFEFMYRRGDLIRQRLCFDRTEQ